MSKGFLAENFCSPHFLFFPWGADEVILQVLLDNGPMSKEDLIKKSEEMLVSIRMVQSIVILRLIEVYGNGN
jgi:hypothetical protein